MNLTEIMKAELPPYSPYNNARAYHIRKLQSFEKYPSTTKAQELEQLGYCVDWAEDDQIFDSLQATNFN